MNGVPLHFTDRLRFDAIAEGAVFAGVIAWAPRRTENPLCGCTDG